MKMIETCFKNETKKWIDNNKKINIILQKKLSDEVDKKRFIQLICEKYFIVKKHVLLKYDVIKKIFNMKQNNESIREYYERVNNFFIVELDYRDRTKDVTLSEKELRWLTFVIEKWIKEVKSTKLLDYLVNTSVDNLFHAYIIAKQWLQKKKKRKRQQQKKHIRLQQQLQKFVNHARSQKFFESSSILEEISCDLSEISIAILNSSDIKSMNEILAFESREWSALITLSEFTVVNKSSSISLEKSYQMLKNRSISNRFASSSSFVSSSRISKSWLTQNWRAKSSFEMITVNESSSIVKKNTCSLSESCIVNITNISEKSVASESTNWSVFTSLQTSLLEVSLVDESSSVLKQIRSEISKINAVIVNIEVEAMNEILASESRKWTVASAEKKIFDSIVTSHAISKSSFVSHIEKNIETVKVSNKACVESIVDVKILKQKIFALIVIFDAFSKNSFASYIKNIEFSIAVNMSSLKHLTKQNDSTTEAFDSVIEIRASSKNPSIQQIENSKTLRKNSIYIYEIFALFIFDLSIDIDFDLYIIDIEAIKSHATKQTICELSALSTFDLSIDVDFNFFAIDIETESFDWSRFCTSSISRCISSVSICISVSNVAFITSIVTFIDTNVISIEIMNKNFYERKQSSSFCFIDSSVSTSIEIVDIEFCERKQSFCFIDSFVSTSIECVVSENIDFYERKQFCFSVDDIVDAIATVVVYIDALILIADMIKKKKKKKSTWMSLLNLIILLIWIWIEYLITSKHKRLSKMKIKRLQESKHIESRS